MKIIAIASTIGVFAIYSVYLQLQINELRDSMLVVVPASDVIKKFDGGPFIPVKSPMSARIEPAVSASELISEVGVPTLVADRGVARDIGEFIPVDSMSTRTIVESAPRSIGPYRGVDDETPRPEALAEPRNIGEYIPVKLAGG
jgi:hypothetical protein